MKEAAFTLVKEADGCAMVGNEAGQLDVTRPPQLAINEVGVSLPAEAKGLGTTSRHR